MMAPQRNFNRGSCGGSERGIISQAVTVGPQITGARVLHTGSAFLLLTVTAPTDVCLNRPPIHGEITSPAEKQKTYKKSPPTPPSPPMLQRCLFPFCSWRTDWDTKSSETLDILSTTPRFSLLGSDFNGCDPLFTSGTKTEAWRIHNHASLQIREHFHGLDCREKNPPTITKMFSCKIKWKYCSTECILTQSGTEYFSFNTFNMYP